MIFVNFSVIFVSSLLNETKDTENFCFHSWKETPTKDIPIECTYSIVHEEHHENSFTIMSRCQHRSPRPSLITHLYRLSPPGGLQGYILYRHRAVVDRSKLVVLPLLVQVKRSTGVYRLWVRTYFSSSFPHVWFV